MIPAEILPYIPLIILVAQVIAFLLIGTFILKTFFGAKSYIIASMLRSEKIVSVFDKFVPFKTFFNFISDAGLIIGFGTVALDSLYFYKYKRTLRIVLNAFSFIIFFVLAFLFFNPFSGNSMVPGFDPLILATILAFSFALFGISGFMLVTLAVNALDIVQKILLGVRACPGVAPLIPGVRIPGVPFFVPEHGWISLFIILVIHEGFHGVLSRVSKINVKSAGLLLAGLLPIGAFVEPDEKQLNKLPDKEQLRIFSAGASANIFTGFVFMLIALLLFSLVLASTIDGLNEIRKESIDSVIIGDVSEKIEFCGNTFEASAFGNIDINSQIISINKIKINETRDAMTVLASDRFKGIEIELITPAGEDKNVSLEPNEIGSYGFSIEEKTKPDYSFPEDYEQKAALISLGQSFFAWLIILSFLLGLVNFLPVSFFDGGRISTIFLKNYFFTKKKVEERKKVIAKSLLILTIILLILNALPLFI